MRNRFQKSAQIVLANGERLINEVEYLDSESPPNTAYFLILMAQEEIAKAFLLGLVYRGIIPWSKHILRATRDHRCKQLLFLVMDYLNPEWEEFIRRCDSVVIHKQLTDVPGKICDAINILRYEKIGRWESNTWFWADDPNWDIEALGIADGALEEVKQDSIYVRLGRDGSVIHTPRQNKMPDMYGQRECAKRMAELVKTLIDKTEPPGLDWEKIEGIFRVLFTESAKTKTIAN